MQKDNLTDVVENLPQSPNPDNSSLGSTQQQVINNDGETVTLGQEQA